jgi:hypothetical protein
MAETITGGSLTLDGNEFTFDNLTLSQVNVILRHGAELFGRELSLLHSSISTSSNGTIYAPGSVNLDHTSFIGVRHSDAKLSLESVVIKNAGILEAKGHGADLVIAAPISSPHAIGSLDNEGSIIATDGGKVTLMQEGVGGSGDINLSHGGELDLSGKSTIQFGPKLDMGGRSGTKIAYDPNPGIPQADVPGSSINAEIYRFARTDQISLQDFSLGHIVSVLPTGTDDTTVSFSGITGASSPFEQPFSFSLTFEGRSYRPNDFHLRSSNGGEILTTTHG